jgi:hypothetical protein
MMQLRRQSFRIVYTHIRTDNQPAAQITVIEPKPGNRPLSAYPAISIEEIGSTT